MRGRSKAIGRVVRGARGAVPGVALRRLGTALLLLALVPAPATAASRGSTTGAGGPTTTMTTAATAVTAVTAAPPRILIAGDSLTQGSAGDYTWRYRLWQRLRSTAPGATFVGTRTDLHDVVSGRDGSHAYAVDFAGRAHDARWADTYLQARDRVASQVRATSPDVLVVLLGANDLASGASASVTVARAVDYIARARAARPGLDVVVGQVTDRYDTWTHRRVLAPATRDFAERLDAMAARLDTPAQRVVVARTTAGWDPARDTWDGTLPTPTGEVKIAARVGEALGRIGIGAATTPDPGTVAWQVPGPAPQVAPGPRQVRLRWDRARSGATGMYVEERLPRSHEAWHRLPYPMSGNGGTVSHLVPGATYQFRLVPVKGTIAGTPGPVRQARIAGPRLGVIRKVAVTPRGAAEEGGQQAVASWTRARNANAYLLGYRVLSNGIMTWTTLPYPATDPHLLLRPLQAGRRYQVRVRPARGYARGRWTSAPPRRIFGIPSGWVQESLGDSYSAGLGSSKPYTDVACRRTSGAWPLKIFWDQRAHVDDLACSGATMTDLAPQLKSMRRAFAARRGQPQLITLTIGGNDAGFTKVLTACVVASRSCRGMKQDLIAGIDALEPRLERVYRTIRRAHPYADVMVGGYPDVVERGDFSDNVSCARMDPDERQMIHDLAGRLNRRIAEAARRAGIWSVGQAVRRSFSGHNACTAGRAWIHPASVGYGGPMNPVDSASFHPNDRGQRAYADVFAAAISAAGQR